MGTRSNIGVQNADGSVVGIYCHWDSYLSHHVPLLTQHYETHEKASAMVALGDMSSLGASIGEKHDFDARPGGVCNYYGRDRGEKGTEAQTFPDCKAFEKWADNGYAYLFRDGQCWARTSTRDPWTLAADLHRDDS